MAVPPSYPSAADEADQRLLSRVATETQIRRQRQALREEAQRTEPITGRASQYDKTTGDWLISTDQGGTVRAQLNSNGQPVGRVYLATAADAQIGEISAPPSAADISPLLDQINGLSDSLVNLNGARPVATDPNADPPAIPRYPNEIIRWQGLAYSYDAETSTWVSIGGGGNPVGYVNIQYPRADVFPVMSPAIEALEIVSITSAFQVGSGTFNWSHAVGQIVAEGGTLSVTLSNLSTDGGDPPLITARRFTAAIEFARPTLPPPTP